MEENSSSDDETKQPVSHKFSGKKVKLNDGSSHDSFKEPGPLLKATCSKDEKDENVDSGLSADKSESTSSEDRSAAPGERPLNEIVALAPSSSNVRAILLNIRHSRRTRNYRKRKTSGQDSDSDSSDDSDDLSVDDNGPNVENENSEMDSLSSEGTPSLSTITTSGSSVSNSNESDNELHIPTVESDSDESPWLRSSDYNDDEDADGKQPTVLTKTRPKHKYIILKEIIKREMGLTFPCGKAIRNDVIFEQKFYGSLHAVYRMDRLHSLFKHKGCVNSINFHPEGRLLVSGSDDIHVVLWDWAKNKVLQNIRTGHRSNVFQSKFLHLNTQSQINIATCARDGQVRLLTVGGAGLTRRRLAVHGRSAHKIHVSAAEPHLVLSAGEDGLVLCADVRRDRPSKLITVKHASHGNSVPLYSLAGHPLSRHELLLAGHDRLLRVYDTRRTSSPLATYCPAHFRDASTPHLPRKHKSLMHLTCAVYNHDGTEILGSYNDEEIYLFDTKNDVYDTNSNDGKDGYTHRYSGHRNSATFKGVAFFGPKSQYVVSGSDCGHVYIWDKESEAIVQWMEGDINGVVNCIETHPKFPIMATSGLDKDVKLWIPKRQEDPTYIGMEKVVRENSVAQRSPLFNDFLPTLYSAWRGDGDNTPPNVDFEGNMCTAF